MADGPERMIILPNARIEQSGPITDGHDWLRADGKTVSGLRALLRRAHDAMSRREPDGISDAEWDQLVADLARPQIVQPWWFGDAAFKATGLYTRGLPQLATTQRLTPPKPGTDDHKAWSMIHRAPPGPDRWKVRSKTFAGMAEAWADQYGGWALQVAA